MNPPDLSIVVAVYDMQREFPRTLESLATTYQVGVSSDRYEVIVVDNGSPIPVERTAVERFGQNFHLETITDAKPSPASAMNRGVARATGRWVGLMIDGARMVTPGTVGSALAALDSCDAAVIETMAFHLGPHLTDSAARREYDRATEDELLAGIGWPADGYRLFEIASLALSSGRGWFGPLSESNCMFMSADTFHRHQGYDERFDRPGGGMVNNDFYRRVMSDGTLTQYRLRGEATFHQMHGGAATGLSSRMRRLKAIRWMRQYKQIRGVAFEPPGNLPLPWGETGPCAAPWMARSSELWTV